MAWCQFLNLRIEYAGWMEISKSDRTWRIGPRRSLKTNEKRRFQKRGVSKGRSKDSGIHSQGLWPSVLVGGEGSLCFIKDVGDLEKNDKVTGEELTWWALEASGESCEKWREEGLSESEDRKPTGCELQGNVSFKIYHFTQATSAESLKMWGRIHRRRKRLGQELQMREGSRRPYPGLTRSTEDII